MYLEFANNFIQVMNNSLIPILVDIVLLILIAHSIKFKMSVELNFTILPEQELSMKTGLLL